MNSSWDIKLSIILTFSTLLEYWVLNIISAFHLVKSKYCDGGTTFVPLIKANIQLEHEINMCEYQIGRKLNLCKNSIITYHFFSSWISIRNSLFRIKPNDSVLFFSIVIVRIGVCFQPDGTWIDRYSKRVFVVAH